MDRMQEGLLALLLMVLMRLAQSRAVVGDILCGERRKFKGEPSA
jgi:hypothetical protein